MTDPKDTYFASDTPEDPHYERHLVEVASTKTSVDDTLLVIKRLYAAGRIDLDGLINLVVDAAYTAGRDIERSRARLNDALGEEDE